MAVDYSVISIGTLSRNRFWNEGQAKRAAHATTTLVRDGLTAILVDPGLPPELLQHRLDERSGLRPDQIDVVFLTTFRPVHRRSLALFERATWLMHEPEVDAIRDHLAQMTERARTEPDEIMRLVREERSLLERIRPAPEKITPGVHLFPTLGVTPGASALLLALALRTVVVAGDAVVTKDYYDAGRVFEQVADVAAAQDAFTEIVEIADEVVPGHDNAFRAAGR
jgi:glyoxylase-like metal-dependent hydrolase (beta-lactamase superfamily II)